MKKYYGDVVTKDNVQNFLNRLDQRSLLIYSPTSLANIELKNNKVHMIDSRVFSRNVMLIDALIKSATKYDNVVSLGGGTATDIAKFIALKADSYFTCIPSMLSTNSYSTDKVALVLDKDKITLDAKLADRIIFDAEFISTAIKQNLYGLADVLSIHTALFDWKIANSEIKEIVVLEIFNMADVLLSRTKNFFLKNSVCNIQHHIEEIFQKVGDAGYITNLYGTGRPESGSEHIFAKRLEQVAEIPHGLSVSVGVVLMSILQNNKSADILKCINKIGTLNELESYNITRSVLRNVLRELKPRKGRYSIIDSIVFDNKTINSLLDDFENSVQVKLRS